MVLGAGVSVRRVSVQEERDEELEEQAEARAPKPASPSCCNTVCSKAVLQQGRAAARATCSKAVCLAVLLQVTSHQCHGVEHSLAYQETSI